MLASRQQVRLIKKIAEEKREKKSLNYLSGKALAV